MEKINVSPFLAALETEVDDKGVLRYKKNEFYVRLHESGVLDLNNLCIAFQIGKILPLDYIAFKAGLGYSVDGLWDVIMSHTDYFTWDGDEGDEG